MAANQVLNASRNLATGSYKSISEVLLQSSKEVGGSTAVILSSEGVERRRTYDDLASRSLRLAGGLSSLGIIKGKRVGALVPNGIEFVEAWIASSLLGAVFVPLNTALKGSLLDYQMRDSGIEALFYDTRLVSNLEGTENWKSTKRIKIQTAKLGEGLTNNGDSLDFESVVDHPEVIPKDLVSVEPSDPASILYTSGTTNSPKGVVLSHAAYLNRVKEISEILGARKDDLFLNTLPMFHTSGQVMTTLPAFMNRGTLVIEEWFHASRFWKSASKYQTRFSFLLMTMVNALLKRKEEFARNSLEIILCGGANSDVWKEFESTFGVRLLEGYGMTETCGVAIYNTQSHYKFGSIGMPLPSVDAVIMDDNEEKLSSMQKGEICLRQRIPNTMMSEYFNRPDETGQVVKDGWLHTGDIGYRDSDGFYFFVERKKDIIRRKGENISPSDIERVVSRNDLVIECSAVGVPSHLGEEEVALYLVLRKTESIDGLSFLKWLDKELPFYMMPRFIRVIEALPKTANHKVQRSKLKEKGNVVVLQEIDADAIGFRATRPRIG